MNTKVCIAGIGMKNPVTVSSGTFGFGQEYAEFVDLNKLGGIFTKAISLKARQGNPPPRICESPSGMLNAIGLQNPGVQYFVQHLLPYLKKYDTAVIVNAIGNTIQDYVEVCKILNRTDIDGVELNLSCPNTKDGMAFGTSQYGIQSVVNAVKQVLDKPLIVKLTPNVTNIADMAVAAQQSGADAVSLVNTFKAMVIDVNTRKPIIGNNMGGLSGPAIRPIAVRMVYEVARAVTIPIVGLGGIISGSDAIQFILAGATAVSIGTGNFCQPDIALRVIDEIESYMQQHGVASVDSLIGSVVLN